MQVSKVLGQWFYLRSVLDTRSVPRVSFLEFLLGTDFSSFGGGGGGGGEGYPSFFLRVSLTSEMSSGIDTGKFL